MKEKNSIQDVVKVIKKRIFLIFSIVVIVSGIVAGINYYLLPDIFQAQTQILVNQKVRVQREIHGHETSLIYS